MRFEEQNNETKITTMLDKIYKKLAGDEAEVDTNLDAYPNDVKVLLLLEKIYEVVDNSGGNSGAGIVRVNIKPNGHIGSVTSGTADKTYDELLSANTEGNLIIADIKIGNGGGPDARAIPLTYNGYNALVGASVLYYYGASKLYELNIEITEHNCTVTGRAI